MDWIRLPSFVPMEFTCRCGCGRNEMDADFMDALQRMRSALGFSFPINSGYRCPDYNQQVSSTGPAGPHTTGRAADVRVLGARAFDIIHHASLFGFTGIGVKQHGSHASRFVHLDTLTAGPRPWVWSYP